MIDYLLQLIYNPFALIGFVLGCLIYRMIKLYLENKKIIETMFYNKEEFEKFNKCFKSFIEDTFDIDDIAKMEHIYFGCKKAVIIKKFNLKSECLPHGMSVLGSKPKENKVVITKNK